MSISSISSNTSVLLAAMRTAPQQTAAPQAQKMDSDGDYDNSGAVDSDSMIDIKA